MKFTEAVLEAAIIDLLGKQGYPHVLGDSITRQPDDVLITADLRVFLTNRYAADGITDNEINSIIRTLQNHSSADLYESNKAILRMVTDGFLLKREDRSQKDLFIELIDYRDLIPFRQPRASTGSADDIGIPVVIAERPAATYRASSNIVKIVNQLTITGRDGQTRIPDGILYINGLPLVVFEFKSAIRENTTIWDAFDQLTNRYRRDIPELFKYNAFCVISDGVNSKAGTLFSAYEFYYSWRKSPHPQPLSHGERGARERGARAEVRTAPLSASPSGRGGGKGFGRGRGEGDINYRGNVEYGALKKVARELRQKQTPAEEIMWQLLRNRKVASLKFRRQHQIGTYIVDFYCHELHLVVELDGGYHNQPAQREKDKERDAYLKSAGFDIMRVTNERWLEQTEAVLREIVERKHPHPQPFSQREKGALSPSPRGRGVRGEGSDGIDSLYTMISGLFHQATLLDVIRNFIYFPDSSRDNKKILCRYPQYYAAVKLYQNILAHMRPHGDGKGGTYFGATGCGKSYTMLFLSRLLMRSVDLASPTIVLITDRTDLDDQLSTLFGGAKKYINDDAIISVASRDDLREQLKDRSSGGVFLTTVHKFNEDIRLLSERNNIICISDEAHRSQVNLDQKVIRTPTGVRRTFGFAKYLHDSLPNATYVGFTGTPIDATLDVFGPVVDAYTMTESVADEITVPIVYEGRAAKVLLDNGKLQEIEAYYAEAAAAGASEYAIEASKRANLKMHTILGDPKRIHALAVDFITHYETRIAEGTTVAGKAMFVSSSRQIAYAFYQQVIALRPAWAEVKPCADGATLSEQEKKELLPLPTINMVMTRGKDDPAELYDLLGTKEDRKTLDRQFKNANSNFKIAIVVDMWLTGFDVPFLDTMYIDKPIQRHSLIQTISRVNRKFEQKQRGLIVDYIGIKKQMNLALAHYSKSDSRNFEEVVQSLVILRDHLDLLQAIFHRFNTAPYFNGTPLEQLDCLKLAAEFIQATEGLEKRYMALTKRLKAAYDICVGSGDLSQAEKDLVHFYLATRSIIYKLTKGDAPDLMQMNAKVQKLITDALQSDGVEEVFKMGQGEAAVNIFSDDYLAKIDQIKLPNTKVKLLQRLLAKAIDEFKKVNRLKGVDFAKQFQALVDRYNDRGDLEAEREDVAEDIYNEIVNLYHAIKEERESFADLGIDFEEKAFYDILLALTVKYDFEYPNEKLIELAKGVKQIVDDKAKYTDWSQRDDIKAELKVALIMLLDENDYPPIDRAEVYQEVFAQAENFKKYQ